MKSIASASAIFWVAIIVGLLTGCATHQPPPEIKHITTTQYVVIEVPDSYLAATKPTPASMPGCTGSLNWKECATSRSKLIVDLYSDIGQCNADKYRTRQFLSEQSKIVKERNKAP